MIKAPTHFKLYHEHKNAVHVSDDDVQRMINEVANRLYRDPELGYAFQATGDCFVFGYVSYESEDRHTNILVEVVVARNYTGFNAWTKIKAHRAPDIKVERMEEK